MSRWMQMVAVALAAVVGLVPAFAQLGYAQAVPESGLVTPVGEELLDEELWIVGEAYPGFTKDLFIGATVGITTGFIASQSGASLKTSITAGILTFFGYLAGVWPRPPTSPSFLQFFLMDMLDPMWKLRNLRPV